jgi:hypothetical protein
MKEVCVWAGDVETEHISSAMAQLADLAPSFNMHDVHESGIFSMPLVKYTEAALQYHLHSYTFVKHGGLGLSSLDTVLVDLVKKQLVAKSVKSDTCLVFGGTVSMQRGMASFHVMNLRCGGWTVPFYVNGDQHKAFSNQLPVSPWLARIVDETAADLTTTLHHEDVEVQIPSKHLEELFGKPPPAPSEGTAAAKKKAKAKEDSSMTPMTFRMYYLKMAESALSTLPCEVTRVALPGETKRKGGRNQGENPFPPEVDFKLLLGGTGFELNVASSVLDARQALPATAVNVHHP